MAQLEIKKMKQGMSYSCKEKTIILNVFKYFRNNFPEKCVTDIVRRTARATGCSEKSIFQFRKEEASVEGFKEPSKTKVRKNININSRDIKYDSNVRQTIRNIIYDLKYRSVIPSLNTILKHVNGDNQLPNFSLMTLRRLMFDMGFYYEKNGNKSILTEKPIVNQDNVPTKNTKHSSNHPQQLSINNANITNQHNNRPPVPAPVISQNICNVSSQNHFLVNQSQRIMPVHMSIHDNPVIPSVRTSTPHNTMPIMLNHRRDLMPISYPGMATSNLEHHAKRDIQPWVHPHSMIK